MDHKRKALHPVLPEFDYRISGSCYDLLPTTLLSYSCRALMVLLPINKKQFADGKIRYAHFLAYAEHQDSICLTAASLPERKQEPFLDLRHIQAYASLLLMQAIFATLLF